VKRDSASREGLPSAGPVKKNHPLLCGMRFVLRLPAEGLCGLVRLYQRFISPLKGTSSCRFRPTCSQYAIDALRKRSLPAALILIVWRILRCNPYGRGGYDPVPDKGFRRVK